MIDSPAFQIAHSLSQGIAFGNVYGICSCLLLSLTSKVEVLLRDAVCRVGDQGEPDAVVAVSMPESGLQIVFNVEGESCHHPRGCALVPRLPHPAKRQDTVFCGHGKNFSERPENLAVIFVERDAFHRLTSGQDYSQTMRKRPVWPASSYGTGCGVWPALAG